MQTKSCQSFPHHIEGWAGLIWTMVAPSVTRNLELPRVTCICNSCMYLWIWTLIYVNKDVNIVKQQSSCTTSIVVKFKVDLQCISFSQKPSYIFIHSFCSLSYERSVASSFCSLSYDRSVASSFCSLSYDRSVASSFCSLSYDRYVASSFCSLSYDRSVASSFCSLSYDRSVASSKASSPQNAI
jgi:hypothetical protein